LISQASFTRAHARRCAPVSDPELVIAPNLHEMASGLSHFFAFGLAAQCNFVHRHKLAAKRRTRPWPESGGCILKPTASMTIMSHALRIARHQQFRTMRSHGLPGGDDGAERGCGFPLIPGMADGLRTSAINT
jgi:hypothetical protein